MTDPTTSASAAVAAVSSAGISLWGISIGLRPELMLAGLWGAFWALSYADPMPLWRRAALSVTASVLAGYSTPAAMAILGSVHVLEGEGVHEKLQYPFAVGVGFLSHRILGPFLLRIAKKKADEVAP